MKNILAAIMLMSSTVSVDAMMITEVIEVIKATNRYGACNRQEIAKLNQMSNQESYVREYLVLECTMMADAAHLCTLATQWRNGNIEEAEEIKRQGQEYTQRLVNSYYDCRDHLRSWQAASENNPSFKDKLRTFFGLRSRPAEIISIVKANLKAIKMGALNLRRDLPGGKSTSVEIAAAKADRALKKAAAKADRALKKIASYASDIQAVGDVLSRPFPWADKVSDEELEEELQNLTDLSDGALLDESDEELEEELQNLTDLSDGALLDESDEELEEELQNLIDLSDGALLDESDEELEEELQNLIDSQ